MVGVVLSGVGVLLVAGVVVVLAVVALSTRRPGQVRTDAVVAALAGARRRALFCLAVGLVVVVAAGLVDAAEPGHLGLPLALAPGLAASAGLLALAALPAPVSPAAGPVTASSTPRNAWSYGTRRAFAVPGGLAVVTLAFLGWAASVASPDDLGRMRSYALADVTTSASAGPFPGSFYGVPLAVVTVLLAGSAYVGLRRVAGTATLPDPLDADEDRRWRAASSRLVVRLTSAALSAHLGGVAAFAGVAMRGAARTLVANGGRTSAAGPAGTTILLVGAALVLTALVALLLAVREALLLTARVDAAAVPATGVAAGPAS